MFYCEPCGLERDWPTDFYLPRSRGPCEICKNVTGCFDVPSSSLPTPRPITKNPVKLPTQMIELNVYQAEILHALVCGALIDTPLASGDGRLLAGLEPILANISGEERLPIRHRPRDPEEAEQLRKIGTPEHLIGPDKPVWDPENGFYPKTGERGDILS